MSLETSKIYHGDCFDYFDKIQDKSIDLIFVDLPYGTTENKWDSLLPLNDYIEINNKRLAEDEYYLYAYKNNISFIEAKTIWDEKHQKGLWTHYERIIKDNGCILLYSQTPFDKTLATSNLKLLRYEWIWEKTTASGHLNAKISPMKAHENILVFYKHKPTYNPIMTQGHRKVSKKASQEKCINSSNYGKQYYRTDYDSDERYPRSVQKFSSDKQKGQVHPTQKPLALTRYFIETYTNKGDLVLDHCSGGGTTAIGCIQTDREYICIEKEYKYYEKSLTREKEALGEVGLFV